jgi:hypothetical protein
MRPTMHTYTQDLQDARLLHFKNEPKNGYRLLCHFYHLLFFEDETTDLWVKRFVRDHVRYLDSIYCKTGEILKQVKDKVREYDPSNTDAVFNTLHIRRGDFQYKGTRIEADEIAANILPEFEKGSSIFVATDERKLEFFDAMCKDNKPYHCMFLDDFKESLGDINPNYIGMIDQLMSAQGKVFAGTFFSTFTGYINRMRGYRTEKAADWEGTDGTINSFYFAIKKMKFEMRKYYPIRNPSYAREYPVSWRAIDGIDTIGKHHGVDSVGLVHKHEEEDVEENNGAEAIDPYAE